MIIAEYTRLKSDLTRLASLWTASGRSVNSLDVWLVDDESINAGSFGEGTFALWSGLRQLTDAHLDAVLAHELAHDRLLHSKKSAELRDGYGFYWRSDWCVWAQTKRRLKRSGNGLEILWCHAMTASKNWKLTLMQSGFFRPQTIQNQRR